MPNLSLSFSVSSSSYSSLIPELEVKEVEKNLNFHFISCAQLSPSLLSDSHSDSDSDFDSDSDLYVEPDSEDSIVEPGRGSSFTSTHGQVPYVCIRV
jgi:hypothetical protein